MYLPAIDTGYESETEYECRRPTILHRLDDAVLAGIDDRMQVKDGGYGI